MWRGWQRGHKIPAREFTDLPERLCQHQATKNRGWFERATIKTLAQAEGKGVFVLWVTVINREWWSQTDALPAETLRRIRTYFARRLTGMNEIVCGVGVIDLSFTEKLHKGVRAWTPHVHMLLAVTAPDEATARAIARKRLRPPKDPKRATHRPIKAPVADSIRAGVRYMGKSFNIDSVVRHVSWKDDLGNAKRSRKLRLTRALERRWVDALLRITWTDRLILVRLRRSKLLFELARERKSENRDSAE
jgi:hypothetical protein